LVSVLVGPYAADVSSHDGSTLVGLGGMGLARPHLVGLWPMVVKF